MSGMDAAYSDARKQFLAGMARLFDAVVEEQERAREREAARLRGERKWGRSGMTAAQAITELSKLPLGSEIMLHVGGHAGWLTSIETDGRGYVDLRDAAAVKRARADE